MSLALYALLLGCTPKVTLDDLMIDTGTDTADSGDTDSGDTDTGDTDTGDTDTGTPLSWGLVTTTTDYTTGVLATVDSDGTLHDNVLPVSSDAAVVAEGDRVYVLNRSSENTVQVFDGGDFSAPTVEFSTGDDSDPVGIASCGGSLFVSRYLVGDLGVYDPSTGLSMGVVNLDAFADADGSSEPDSVYAAPNGYLYVSLNQLDYGGTYNSVDGSGTLVKIDCSTRNVVASWDVGPNPRFSIGADPDVLWIYGGDYFNADYSGPSLDGHLAAFNTADDTLSEPLLTEADAGGNLGSFTEVAGGLAMMTIDSAYEWTVACVDVSAWTYTTAPPENIYIGGMTATPDGKVWASQNAGFGSGVPHELGFVQYDPATCTAGTSVRPALGASSVAVRTW